MMLSKATRFLARPTARCFSSVDQFSEYGKAVFTGKVADDYLTKHGASADLLKDPTWVQHSSDKVAAAVFDWLSLIHI